MDQINGEKLSDSLKIKTVVNVGYNSAARVITFLLTGLASVILARNLDASDYGVVGFALIVTGFLSRFSDLGINSAMIQKPELDQQGLDTGFTVKLILGGAVFLVAFFTAPLASRFLDHAATPTIIRLLSLNFLISSFSLLPMIVLTRALHYRSLFLPQVGSALVNFILSAGLALAGFKYWSIVIANIAATLANVVLLNVAHPVRLRLHIDWKTAAGLLRFGFHLFGTGLVIFAMFNADNFAVGSVLGSAALGLYALAFNWGSMICNILAEVVHHVLFPTFSRMNTDRDGLRRAYLKVLEYTSFIGILCNACLFVVAEEFLYLILGQASDKWMPALTAFRILCLYGIVRSLLEPLGNVLLALGLPNLIARACLLAGAIELVLLYPALVFFGIEGVALLVTVAYAMQYVYYYRKMRNIFGLSVREVLATLRPALIALSAMVLIYAVAVPALPGISWITFFAKLLSAAGGFVFLYGVITGWKLFLEAHSLIRAALSKREG